MPKPDQSPASQTPSEVDKLRQQVETLLEENAHLKLLVAKYRRLHFGQKSCGGPGRLDSHRGGIS